MNLVILGPQGSGKGTQAELLVEKFGLNYVETGKLMRDIAQSRESNYSKIVSEHIDKGLLVPEELVKLIAWEHIKDQDMSRGILFDGYPRTILQYEQLKEMLMKFGKIIDRVIFLNIPEKETIRRLSARRTCEKCGKIYNLITNPPEKEKACECGGMLVHREDDKPEALERRLRAYKVNTMPIVQQARDEGILIEIDGLKGIEEINNEIISKLT